MLLRDPPELYLINVDTERCPSPAESTKKGAAPSWLIAGGVQREYPYALCTLATYTVSDVVREVYSYNLLYLCDIHILHAPGAPAPLWCLRELD